MSTQSALGAKPAAAWNGENFRSHENKCGTRIYEIRCSSECHQGDRWREVTKAAYYDVKAVKKTGICKSCSSKAYLQKQAENPKPKVIIGKARVAVKCPICGFERLLLAKTVETYRWRGLLNGACAACQSRAHGSGKPLKKISGRHVSSTGCVAIRTEKEGHPHDCGLCVAFEGCLYFAARSNWNGWKRFGRVTIDENLMRAISDAATLTGQDSCGRLALG